VIPDPPELLSRLGASLEANGCEVHVVGPDADLPATVARLALAARAAAPAERPPVALATGVDGAAGPLVEEVASALALGGSEPLTPGDPAWAQSLPAAAVGITVADVAAAAEGVIGLRSGPGLPRAASLVPPVHLCVIAGSVVEPDFEAALRRVLGDALPSALSWVGGPSRTGDLEMRTTMGVHGPLRLVAVLASGV